MTQNPALVQLKENAKQMDLIHANEGHKIMADLEYALNDMYTQIYEETYQK